MRVVVVALGKIGLPLAVQIALAGHDVVGCDIDRRVVDLVNQSIEPFPGEAGLADALREVIGNGRLRAVTDTSAAVAERPDLVVAVPPLVVDADARPEWRILDAVVEDIGRGLTQGTTVCIETTLPVATTRTRVAPALERHSGLVSEIDFFTIHSPERVYSGRIFHDLRTYPKLVGGLTPEGEQRGVDLYRSFLDAEVWGMGSAEAAELTKLAETTYRDVNIALANEFARHADQIQVDIHKVIEAANSQPFSHIHRPGVAVGGHCIPVYPRFYLAGDPDAQLPGVARDVNEGMPRYATDLLAALLNGDLTGMRVLILGVAYRGGVKEPAFTGAVPLREALSARGANVVAADPLFDDAELRALGFEPWDGTPVDGAVVQSDHDEYRSFEAGDLGGARAVVDGRNMLDVDSLRAAGIAVGRIGRP